MPARHALSAARLWSRFGTICGGRLSNCTASKRRDRRLIERERSARCKASWQSPSENVGGFVLRRPFRHKYQQASEHVAQGDFTRQHDRQGDADEGRALRFDFAGFGFSLGFGEASQRHYIRRIHTVPSQDASDSTREIQWQERLLVAIRALIKCVGCERNFKFFCDASDRQLGLRRQAQFFQFRTDRRHVGRCTKLLHS